VRGGGAPIGLWVSGALAEIDGFKTVCGAAIAVPGGFDSHAPPPDSSWSQADACLALRVSGPFARRWPRAANVVDMLPHRSGTH